MDAESESLCSLVRPQHTDLIRQLYNGRNIIIIYASRKSERTIPGRIWGVTVIDDDLVGCIIFGGKPHTACGVNLNCGDLATAKGDRRSTRAGCPWLIRSTAIFNRHQFCTCTCIEKYMNYITTYFDIGLRGRAVGKFQCFNPCRTLQFPQPCTSGTCTRCIRWENCPPCAIMIPYFGLRLFARGGC